MKFKKYMHIERYNTKSSKVKDYLYEDLIYVFPKIDGTNCQTYMNDDGFIEAGNRTRVLSENDNNMRFYQFAMSDERIKAFHTKYPNLRLYGEWMVEHTIKGYREDAMNKFYVFDVAKDNPENPDGEPIYLTYDEYEPLIKEFNLDFIPPIVIIKGGTVFNRLEGYLNSNKFLIKTGSDDIGEGIVLKSYTFQPSDTWMKRQLYCKIVRNEFKDLFMCNSSDRTTEVDIPEKKFLKLLTQPLVEKEYRKFVLEHNNQMERKEINNLMKYIYRVLLDEELVDFVIQNPLVHLNFDYMWREYVRMLKEKLPEVFKK